MRLKLSGNVRENCHALVAISIGQDNQTGNYLSELMELLKNTPKVKKITILKADTLQRHHLKITNGVSEEEALELSKQESLRWDSENAKLIAEFKDIYNVEILKWDDYIKLPYFNKI